MGQIVHIGGDD